MPCVCQTGMRKSLTCPVVNAAAWRCAACCWKNQTCCCSTNRPTTPDAESVAWLERFLHDFEGTVVAITHDRYFLDNVAGWILGAGPRRRYSVGRQLLLPGWSRKTSVWRRKRLRKPPAVSLLRKSWSGCVRARKAVSLRAKPVWHASKS